jgi:hypothetical protein
LEDWLLKVELDGEWEECAFKTRSEAVAAFVALLHDYTALIKRAVLFSPERKYTWRAHRFIPVSRLVH